MGAVEVGECLPAAQAGAGIFERELFGVGEQDVDRVAELVGDSAVGGDLGEFVGLIRSDPSLVQCIAHCGECCDGLGQFAGAGDVSVRPVRVGLEPALHRVVIVDSGDAAAFTFGDERCHLGVEAPMGEFQAAEVFGEGVVAELGELIDNGGQHGNRIQNM